MIQIRDVPNALHRRLKVRAARAAMSLSDYLLMETAERQNLSERQSPLFRPSLAFEVKDPQSERHRPAEQKKKDIGRLAGSRRQAKRCSLQCLRLPTRIRGRNR